MSRLNNLAGIIDHTLLKPEATEQDIVTLCKEASEFGFASVCVNPCWVHKAVRELEETNVKVCTVIGFPLGANIPSIKVTETKTALVTGAKEIDVVINIGRVKMRDENYILQELRRIADTCKSHDALLKVILETSLLTEAEKTFAAQLALRAGADFVKTSTGFASGGATVEDIVLLRQIVGDKAKIKASGGIRTLGDATKMIEAGADRIGASAGVSIVREFLASTGE